MSEVDKQDPSSEAYRIGYRQGQAACAYAMKVLEEDVKAARLEGIRLGLEAAAREADIDWHDPQSRSQARLTVAHIRALDPATIAKDAGFPARKDHRADAAKDAFYVEEADQ